MDGEHRLALDPQLVDNYQPVEHEQHAALDRVRQGDKTQVDLAEIGGSETYVHARRGEIALVAQLSGVHNMEFGTVCTMYCKPDALFVFGTDGALLFAPTQTFIGA